MPAAQVCAQPFGYIVNAADPTSDGTHDSLWQVNLASGNATRIGPLNLPNASNPQSDLEGLAIESGTFMYGVNDATDSLVVVNAVTGAATALGRGLDNLFLNAGGSDLDTGLGFDCDGQLLMTSSTRRSLYRLNSGSGQATVIGGEGRLGARIADIAARGDDVYGIGVDGDEGLYRIDTAAGTATRIGGLGITLSLAHAGLDFDADGNLWAVAHLVDGGGTPQPSRILRLDRNTGAATLGPTTRTGVKSLAIIAPRCDISGGPPPAPAALAAPVNSPWALAALLLSLLGFAWYRRDHLHG